MPNTRNTLDKTVELLDQQIAELEEALTRAQSARAALVGDASPRRGPGRPKKTSGRGPGRPRKAASGSKAAPRKRRRRSGTRADQAVSLVEKNPGISASEIAKTMKIKPNYLYRVLGEMEKEGRVTKKGREYHPGK